MILGHSLAFSEQISPEPIRFVNTIDEQSVSRLNPMFDRNDTAYNKLRFRYEILYDGNLHASIYRPDVIVLPAVTQSCDIELCLDRKFSFSRPY